MESTKTSAAELIRLEDEYGAHNYHPLDVVVHKAQGVWVWDVDGNRYLDFLAAYSAVNQGHAHPRIRKAMHEQSGRVTLTSRAFRNDQLGPLYEQVSKLTGYRRMLPMNSGAEAVETALKAARKWGYKVKGVAEGRAEILVFSGNFHGRTTTIVSFSDDAQYRDGFGPFTPGFTILNTRAFWRPRDDFALFGGVENLGDRFYREHLDFRSGRGLYRPGINFYLLTEVQY